MKKPCEEVELKDAKQTGIEVCACWPGLPQSNWKRWARPLLGSGLLVAWGLCTFRACADTIASGDNIIGTVVAGQTNSYTFSGNPGDNIIVRSGTTNFVPLINLYGPGGALLASAYTANTGYRDAVLYLQLTNSGTFTIALSSYYAGGAGGYGLCFAQLPGPFVVPPGQAGGTLTNGVFQTGTNGLGSLNMWSFSGQCGAIQLSCVWEQPISCRGLISTDRTGHW